MIYDGLGAESADSGAYTVGHQHEQALGAGLDFVRGPLLHIKGAGNVEEIESDTVDYHRKDEHPDTWPGISETEQAETEDPRYHGRQHHLLDSEEFHGYRNQQDAESFRHLGNGNQSVCIASTPGIGEFRHFREMRNERIRKTVGNLQGHAEQHRKYEESSHAPVPEKPECLGSERFGKASGLQLPVYRTGRECKAVEKYDKPGGSGYEKLVVRVLELYAVRIFHEIHEKHAAYESYCTEDPDRRKVLYGIEAVLRQYLERH